MGKSDIIAKEYMEDNTIFADVFNFLLYGGTSVLKSDHLRPLDTVLPVSMVKNGTDAAVQKIRDIYKAYTVKTDGKTTYLLLGIEEQTEVSYIMPVRTMLYDALAYERQVKAVGHRHRQKRDYRGRSQGEYLSGFWKGERLAPVITAVVLLSDQPWDGPTQLHDLLNIPDPRLLPMIENYKLHLIAPQALTKENIMKFKTSLREVLSFIKYSKDKDQLRALVKENPRFATMDNSAAMVIRQCTHSDFFIDTEKKGESFNMCKALDDIRQEGFEHGRKRGFDAGKKRGIEMGRNIQLSMLKNLMESLGVTAPKAMELLKITEPERGTLLAMLGRETNTHRD